MSKTIHFKSITSISRHILLGSAFMAMMAGGVMATSHNNVAQAQEASRFTVAKQAYIVDFNSGMVLLDKNSDERMPTSSMSKVMTAYMAFDALDKGRIQLDDTFPVSEKAWRKGGSKMFVEVGNNVRIEDLIRGVIVQSGNDATIVLAEGLAANEDKFAELMTAKAKELGTKNTNFANASGWPDPDHYSTAKDLSIIADALIRNFPQYYHYYGEKEFTYNNITQANRNPLLHQDIGADGIKTGHTEIAGYGLIGSGIRDGRRVVMVLNGMESTSQRAKESRRLLNWALRSFENITLFKENQSIQKLPVVMGRLNEIDAMIPKDVLITYPKGRGQDIALNIEYKTPLVAPIAKGDQIGEITITIPEMGEVKTPLLAGQSSEELGFFAKVLAKAKLMVFGS